MDELDDQMRELNEESKKFNSGVSNLMNTLGMEPEVKEELKKQQEIIFEGKFYDYDVGKKSLMKIQPKFSFSKSDRFSNHTDTSTSTNYSLILDEELSAKDEKEPFRDVKGGFIASTKRFKEPKVEQKPYTDSMEVKYEKVKKRATGGLINKEHEHKKANKKHRIVIHRDNLSENASVDTLETMDTMNASDLIGPGKYDPNFSQVYGKHKKGGKFGTSNRFSEVKKENKGETMKKLLEDEKKQKQKLEETKQKFATMGKPNEANKKLKMRKETEENLQKRAAQYELKRVEESKFKNQKLILKEKQNEARLNKQHKKEAEKNAEDNKTNGRKMYELFKLMDQLRAARIAPGCYEEDFDQTKKRIEGPCMVNYEVKPHSVSPERKNRMNIEIDRQTGPGYYYAKDDLIKPKIKGFLLKESTEIGFAQALNRIDKKDVRPNAYDIKYDVIDKDVPLGVINPEKKNFTLVPTFEDDYVGPGHFEPDYKLTEKRVDIGVPKYSKLNPYNERIKEIEKMYPTLNDVDTDPVYDLVKKRAPTTVIKDKVLRTDPPNMPENLLWPEHWEFYNANVEATKERTDIGGGFANIDYSKFKLDERDKKILTDYLNMNRRVPDVGYYEPIFSLLDEGVAVPDFGRYLDRPKPMTKDELMNIDIDGDNLILDPAKPQKRIGDIDFGKQTGRPQDAPADLDDMNIVEPNYDPIKPKVKVLVNMDRQDDRKPLFNNDKNQVAGDLDDVVDLNIDYNIKDRKAKNLVNMEKQTGRKQMEKYDKDANLDDVVYPEVNVDYTKPKVVTLVKYEKPHKKIEIETKAAEEPNVINYENFEKSTKPHIPGPSLGKFAARKKNDAFPDDIDQVEKKGNQMNDEKNNRYVQDFGDDA